MIFSASLSLSHDPFIGEPQPDISHQGALMSLTGRGLEPSRLSHSLQARGVVLTCTNGDERIPFQVSSNHHGQHKSLPAGRNIGVEMNDEFRCCLVFLISFFLFSIVVFLLFRTWPWKSVCGRSIFNIKSK